jgi:hypothetical protein
VRKSDSWVLWQYPWVLHATAGTVGTVRAKSDSWVLQGTVGTAGTVGFRYCGYCRNELQGTAGRTKSSGSECCT